MFSKLGFKTKKSQSPERPADFHSNRRAKQSTQNLNLRRDGAGS